MGKQFVVQLENRPGELAHLAHAFAARGINIQHVACIGAGPLACMFVTTDDDAGARRILHGMGHSFIEGQPVVVEVEDRPGGLAEVAARLGAAGVNITGMLEVGRRPGVVDMTLCVDDEAKARDVLGLTIEQPAGVGD
ncbi:MAG: ACT domain-containing protein [Chloroflexota bacterium]